MFPNEQREFLAGFHLVLSFVASQCLLFKSPSLSQQDYSILDKKLQWNRHLGFNSCENIKY